VGAQCHWGALVQVGEHLSAAAPQPQVTTSCMWQLNSSCQEGRRRHWQTACASQSSWLGSKDACLLPCQHMKLPMLGLRILLLLMCCVVSCSPGSRGPCTTASPTLLMQKRLLRAWQACPRPRQPRSSRSTLTHHRRWWVRMNADWGAICAGGVEDGTCVQRYHTHTEKPACNTPYVAADHPCRIAWSATHAAV
jgi:hypothetical protein